MNSHPSPEIFREIDELIDQLLDGQLAPEACQRLETLVCSHPQCSDHYVWMLQLDACLGDGIVTASCLDAIKLDLQSDQPGTLSGPFDPSSGAAPATESTASTTGITFDLTNPATSASLLSDNESRDSGWISGIRQVRDWTFGSWQFPAVVVITACLLGLFYWGRERIAPLPNDDIRPPVVNSLQSDAGTVTLALDKIGTVTIEGPTDFRMVGPLRARLNYGRITVHVSEATGHGFVVETPDGEVTDFGTKFSLNVSKGSDTKLIVREGSVDLRPGTWRQPSENDRSQRLVGGQAVTFNAAGNVQRVMSIFAGKGDDDPSSEELTSIGITPLISSIFDNLRDPEAISYYEIVPQGLREDALAYVDRVGHEWNGIDKRGMPAYLLGADYVKPFNNDKFSAEIEITVNLSRPATLYVFFDSRLPEPEWLLRDFRKTGDVIGLDMRLTMDEAPTKDPRAKKLKTRLSGIGPGKSVDQPFSIWQRVVDQPGPITLGPKGSGGEMSAMYGIAAVARSDSDD
jgi:hypothetical protein